MNERQRNEQRKTNERSNTTQLNKRMVGTLAVQTNQESLSNNDSNAKNKVD